MTNPAMMTFNEFMEHVNPSGKSHPDSAYNRWTVTDDDFYLNQWKMADLSKKGYKQIGAFTSRGHQFVIMTAKNEETFNQQDFKIYDVDEDRIVGSLQDEWGTVLIMVPHDYRDFGIGKQLSDLALKYHADKDSGGFTFAGYSSYKKAHARAVQEAIANGTYTSLVRDGKMTKERVIEIVSSVDKKSINKLKFDTSGNVTTDSKDWLLYHQDDAEFIIYDKRLIEHYKNGELNVTANDYWTEKFLIGVAYFQDMSSNSKSIGFNPARIFKLHGKDNIKKFLLECLHTQMRDDYDRLVFRPEEISVPESDAYTVEPVSSLKPFMSIKFKEQPSLDYRKLALAEAKYRKPLDKYGEFENTLREFADSID